MSDINVYLDGHKGLSELEASSHRVWPSTRVTNAHEAKSLLLGVQEK